MGNGERGLAAGAEPGRRCSRARLLTRAERTFSQATRGRNTRASRLPDRHFTRLGCLCSWLHCPDGTGSTDTLSSSRKHTCWWGGSLPEVWNRPWLKKDTTQNMGLILSFGLQMKASNLAGRRHNYKRIIFITCYKQKLYWEYEIAMSCRS